MPTFKNTSGNYYLNALFYETAFPDKSTVVYTLKDRDHAGYPSLYRLYMEADDPTEYTFATSCLDGWAHWERLLECDWFLPYIGQWRKEVEVRTRAAALLAIREAAKDPANKQNYQANKFLVGGGWKEGGPKRKAGQPSKDEIKKEASRQASVLTTLDEDFQRISGNVQ